MFKEFSFFGNKKGKSGEQKETSEKTGDNSELINSVEEVRKKQFSEKAGDNSELRNKFEDLANEILDEKTPAISEKKELEEGTNVRESGSDTLNLEGLSLVEKLKALEMEKNKIVQFLEEKKKNISQLEEERLEYYYKAKDLEDRMVSLGLSEEGIRKIKQQILEEGKEISQKIIDIRNEYGIEPTPVEILSNRMLMMMAEKDRVSKKMQLEKKDILNFVNYHLEGMKKEGYPNLNNWLKHVLDNIEIKLKNLDNDENGLYEFSEQIKEAMQTEPIDSDLISKIFTNFSEKLNNDIKNNNSYKTPLEEKNDKDRLDKINRIMDNIHSELKMARKGEGRYAKKK
ncbi:MAG TPA: hypothetical protein PK142_01280 [bacterium]|nr:hypothetical protein [bacterium]